MKEFLEKNSSEVINMLFTEFDMDTAVRIWKEEGKKEGRAEEKKEKQIEIAKNLLDVLDIETISKKTGLSIKEIKELF